MPNFKYLFSLIFLLILTPDIFADTPIFSDNFDKGLSSKYRTLKAKGGFTPKVVNKRLRLTNRKHDLSTAVTLDWEFPTKNNKFTLEFDYYAYGGCEDGNDYRDKSAGKWGADGLSIILFDSSVGMNPTVGASGGSLGYADGYIEMVDGSHEYQFGFQKAWLGIGLDEFGSFTVNDEGRKDINGHTDSKNDLQHNEKPNSVGIRGSTNSGYRLLAYKKNISPRLARYIYKKSDSQKKKLYKSGKYRLTVDSTKDNHLYIELKRYKDKWYTLIDSFDAMASKYHQGTKPKNFRLAFSSGTGGGCNYHEIDNLKIYGNGWEYGTPKITISDADITEGDSGEKEITFNITSDIAIPSGKTVTFDYETIDTGSATSGVDFTYKNSSVTMNAGDTSATVKIKIKGDTDVEGDETFKIKLTNPTNATFADDEATGTIKDDDSAGTTGICYALPDDRQKLITFYPNPGASPLPTPQSISLSKEFNGEGSAYRATDGKVYAFKSDNDSDSDPSDLYQIDPNNGSVTKIKSELLPYSVEGAEFYIDPSSGEETLYVIAKEYHSKLYAFDPNDNWSIKSGYPKSITGDTTSIDSIAINPSTGEAYGTDDYDYDSDTPELYRIDLSTGHTTYLTDTASIVDAEGLAYAADGNLYIENELSSNHRIYKINPSTGALTEAVNYDSVSGDFEAISCNGGDINLIATIEDANVTEGNSGTKTMNFTVQLNRSVPSGESVSFHYATSDITATAGSDYFAKSGNLNISSGNDSATISITVKGDTDLEDNETFAVTLSNPTNVVIPDSNATGTIINDDIASSKEISGTIYEDVLGDHQNMQPVDNAKVKLFQDNGNGYLDSQDTFITFKKTANGGKYNFSIQNSGTYFVSVVANTISPSSGFNSGYTIDDVWAEQTYAPKGGFCADGSGGTYTRTDAGSCYGGNRGTLSDDYSNFGKIEHVAKVEITDQNVTDVNFGFSFNVVTNINDSSNLQGSFRQFIKNANAISGANHMRFVPSVAKNASSSWWSVFLNSSLPTIKDNYTIIDGTAYSLNDGTTVRDDNSGSIGGEGGGVGKVGTGNDGVEDSGDETLLPSFNKPEFEINANDKFASAGGNGVTKGVLVIKSSNNNIKNIALYNAAKNNNENDDKSPAVLIASGDNNKVEQNFIGPRANGNDPGAGNRVNNAVYHKSNYALITKNYIAHIHYTGIWASSHCDITYNYLYYPAYEPYGDGITYEDSNGDTITIKKNRIEYAEAYGIEGWGADSSVLIENNTIRANGQGNSNPANGGENGGIRIYGNNNIVRYNIIKDHPGAGVVIASGKGNLISKNSFYNNQGLSIDIDQTHSSGNINGDGVNPNNGTTSLSKPNKGMDYPVITSTSMMEEGGLHIEGYVGKSTQKISGTHTIEIYKAEDDGNSNGEVEEGDGTLVPHGKGKWYIGTCQSSSNGTFSCNLSIPQGVSYHNGDLLTATATDTNNNTSEYGCMKDEKISVSISDANITEGNDKEKNLNFTVTLSKEPGEEGVSFKYETQDITAKTSDKDYEAASSKTITLEGSTTSYTVSILIYGDTKVEDDETFKVILSDISSNAVFSDSEAIGTIINDDMNLSASLKAEYRFDECSYNSTANEVKDTSSNSYDGIGYEMSTSSLAKLGRSADFSANGTDDYISLDYNALNGIEDFTISVWIKTSNTGNQAIVSGTKNNSNYESILMWLSNSTTFSPIILNDQSKSITIPDIADDNWHQLVWTREGAQNCIYIDGNQSGCVNMPTGAVTLVENGLVLGQDQDTINGGFNSSQDFEGKMDELKIFDKALNTTQIQTIYNYEKDGKDYQSGEARGAMECQTPFTCDNTMYISSSIKRGSGEPDGSKIWFHSIDTSTTPFSFNLIGNYYNKTYNAIGYNPKDNFIYGLYGRELLKIDSNGTVDSLGNVQGLPSYQLYSGTFDKNGYYYVGGKYNEDDPNIYKIDISQRKVIQTITMSEHMIVYDFAFSKEGNYLYAIPPNGKFSKISIPDGNVTHIGQNHINYSFDAVFVDNEGRVFANDSYGGGFFEFDPNTGEKFFLSSSQRAQLNDGTNCPNASFIFTDFSDAPSNYGIAKHYILHNTKIGTKTDHDPSSYFSDDALGDDSHGEDDEDGIKVNGVELNAQHLYKNNTYDIQASVTGGGYLSGWIDFNRDGDFEDSGEKILSDKNISSKTIDFNITIPSLATSGESYARFRFSTEPNLSPSGTAIDGEVEDYLIYIEQNDYNITISDANVTEGDEGEDKTISFTVSLSNFAPSSSGGIKVDYATANDTATAGSDYDAKSGTLTFQNNIKDINLTVTVHGNNIPEGDKRFFINLTNARTVNSTTIPVEIEDSQGVGRIINDDSGSFDAIDSYNGSYQSAKGLKTKIVNKPFTLDIVYLPTGNSVGNFYTTNPLIPSMPILLFLQEGTKSTILKDASGTPITATMLPGYNHATTNTGIKINRAIRNAKIKMKYIDLYYLYNQIMDSCLINSSNNGNIQAMPQCVNSSNKYKNAFGQNAYNRCIVNNGQPCTPSKQGVGNPPYDHIYGCYECTADALGNAVISSDNFAVRADKFQIDLSSATPIKAKENFTISFGALTADATPLSAADYNETNGTSFMIDYNETKASCLKGSLSFASALKFSDGNLSISSNYNEAGSIKVEIKEIDGSEFALVDSDDTNSSLRKITAASKTISFIPDHFDVSWSLSQEGRSFTYYSNQLTNMGAKLSLSVKAKNKANTITKNYDKNCYAKNTNLNITFDIDSEESSPLSLQYSDKNLSGVIIPAGSFNAPSLNNNFTTTLKDSNFTQGIADKIYKISFQKNNATVLEPSSLEIKEINATDSDNVSGKKVLSNQKTIFYYGRINTVNSIEGINPINTKIYYEVYCKDCNKTKYHIDGNTSIDTLNWYQNIYHNNASCGQIINTVSLDGSTAITVNPSFDHGTQDINLTNPNAPFLDKIRLTPSGWLQYNAINPSIPYIDFTAKFLNPNTNWAGEGKLGHTVDEKISVRRSKKIDW